MSTPQPLAQFDRWKARLQLDISQRAERSVITHRRHEGPLVIQKPFYPEGGVCHVYLIHPPGGVAGGDDLGIDIRVNEHAHALVTTPASGKFYHALDAASLLYQRLYVQQNSRLEWLPQDNILFNGSRVQMSTQVMLEGNARFIGWEILCLGRPASRESYEAGFCRQRFELFRDGKPLFIERGLFAGSDPLLQAKWGLAGYSVTGTMIVSNANSDILNTARTAVSETGEMLFSASLVDSVLVCRVLGHHADEARKNFTRVWERLRPEIMDRPACPPRIWNT